MTSWSRISFALLLAGCLQPSETVCKDGRVCPESRRCDEIHDLCVLPEQLTACGAIEDGKECPLPAGGVGECDANVCIEQQCGDHLVTGAEECDGDTVADCTVLGYYTAMPLSCNASCTFDELDCRMAGECGDDIVNGPVGREICDGAPPPGTCLDYGFEAGRLECNPSSCAPAFETCRDIGFVPVAQISGETLFDVYVSAPDHMFFAALPHHIIEIDGMTKTTTVLGTTGSQAASAVWGTSATDVFAVSFDASIWHFDGTTWSQSRAGDAGGQLQDVWGSASNDVYAVGGMGRVLHYDGSSWSPSGGAATTTPWQAVWGTSANDVWLAGSGGKVRRYTGSWADVDASACWSALPTPSLEAIWSSSPTDVFVVGSSGVVCHFDGVAWALQKTATAQKLRSVWGRSATDVFAVGDGGVILHFDGAEWWPLQSDTSQILQGVHGTGNTVIVAGQFGVARRYSGAGFALNALPAGSIGVAVPTLGLEYAATSTDVYRHVDGTWTSMGYPANNVFTKMWADAGGDLFIGDGDMSLHHFDGAAWSNVPLGVYPSSIQGRNANEVYVAGGTKVALVKDGAATLVGPVTTGYMTGVAVTTDHLYVIGNDATNAGVIWRYDAATGWSTMPKPGTATLRGIHAVSNNDVFAVGDGGTLLHYDGTVWTAMPAAFTDDLAIVTATSKTDVFAVGLTGLVLHYDGVAWAQMRTPGDPTAAIAVRPDLVLLGGRSQTITAIVRDPSW